MCLGERLWGLNELIDVQFLDWSLIHNKLCVLAVVLICGGKYVQSTVLVLSKKGLTIGEAVGEGRFCRRGGATANFEAQVGVS